MKAPMTKLILILKNIYGFLNKALDFQGITPSWKINEINSSIQINQINAHAQSLVPN